MSSNKKSLGIFGTLGLVTFVLGAIAVGIHALEAFDVVSLLGKSNETLKQAVFFSEIGFPAATVAFGLLGSKLADSGSARGKCLLIAIGGVALLGVFGWMLYGVEA